MNDLELMRMHVAALYTHVAQGRIVAVKEPGGARAPRFFLGRTARGAVWRFRDDLDDAPVAELEAICRAEPVGDQLLDPPYGAERYEAVLARSAPVERTWAGPAFCFPPDAPPSSAAVRVTEENAGLLRPYLEAWLGDVAAAQPMLAVVDGGHAVSVCASVRVTPAADEAGVETAPAFRGRGHAARAVAACGGRPGEGPRAALQHVVGEHRVAGAGRPPGAAAVRRRPQHRVNSRAHAWNRRTGRATQRIRRHAR